MKRPFAALRALGRGYASSRGHHALRSDEAQCRDANQGSDITGLKDLDHIDAEGPRELVFGALARMSDVAAHRRIAAEYPAISESLMRAASQQLCNVATLGGNLLQRTRCVYFRGVESFACNKRKPGSGCAAQRGNDRGHALLGGSSACIAVYPGDFAVALVAFDAC
ncbi:FAD binding domain-containing protein [Bradyrhizobium sp. 151]|uniref:FAD binding domain-containing protein n=1 Tax=Bradyrhizobium sp. 151 TaxID=2782626 RepID=UPI001FF7C932|nr:FAD binding domain-containing protein [Bradyrhizobium sp. 151]